MKYVIIIYKSNSVLKITNRWPAYYKEMLRHLPEFRNKITNKILMHPQTGTEAQMQVQRLRNTVFRDLLIFYH